MSLPLYGVGGAIVSRYVAGPLIWRFFAFFLKFPVVAYAIITVIVSLNGSGSLFSNVIDRIGDDWKIWLGLIAFSIVRFLFARFLNHDARTSAARSVGTSIGESIGRQMERSEGFKWTFATIHDIFKSRDTPSMRADLKEIRDSGLFKSDKEIARDRAAMQSPVKFSDAQEREPRLDGSYEEGKRASDARIAAIRAARKTETPQNTRRSES
jgi:hypothetical protein